MAAAKIGKTIVIKKTKHIEITFYTMIETLTAIKQTRKTHPLKAIQLVSLRLVKPQAYDYPYSQACGSTNE